MDNIKTVNNEFITHIEPNCYLDYMLPGRMLRYRVDIWEKGEEIGLKKCEKKAK